MMLRGFNWDLDLCPDYALELFDPYDDSKFERSVSGLFLLRANLLFGDKKQSNVLPLTTTTETTRGSAVVLVPGLATVAASKMNVTLCSKCSGLPKTAVTVNKSVEMSNISLQSTDGTSTRGDFWRGGFDVLNFDRTPGADGFSVLPPGPTTAGVLLLRQFKSIGRSPSGGDTTGASRFFAFTKVIEECRKAIEDAPTKDAPQNFTAVFVLVTNKKLDGVPKEFASIPEPIIIIHRDNWATAFGPLFSHRGYLRGAW
jgi:hypothetical protein